MKRRSFLSTIALGLASLSVPGFSKPAKAAESDKRNQTIYRWNGNEWELVRLKEVRKGDIFVMEDDRNPTTGEWPNLVAAGDPFYSRDKHQWGISCMVARTSERDIHGTQQEAI